MRIIFIRHGDPDYANDTLTPKGVREAMLLGERVGKWKFDDIYCSPLGRARDTAKYALQGTGREPVICEWLKEFFVPIKDPVTGNNRIAWDFMPKYWTNEEMLFDKDRWTQAPIMTTGNIKAEYEKVCGEFDKLLSGYGYERQGNYYRTDNTEAGRCRSDKTIVIFCHLGISFALIAHMLGISPVVMWQGFFVAPTSVTILCSEERVPNEAFFRVQTLGDTLHLHVGGEPVSGSGYFAGIFQD